MTQISVPVVDDRADLHQALDGRVSRQVKDAACSSMYCSCRDKDGKDGKKKKKKDENGAENGSNEGDDDDDDGDDEDDTNEVCLSVCSS